MKNKTYILVEDLKSFFLFDKENKLQITEYYFFTTSYYVYNYLKKIRFNVEHADKFIKSKDFDNIGHFSFQFSNRLISITNLLSEWRDTYNIGNILSQQIFLYLNTYLYKDLILKKLLSKSRQHNSKFLVIGYSDTYNLDFKLGRTENIFLKIAKQSNKNIKFIDYAEVGEKYIKVNAYSGELKMNNLNKFFSILDNSFNSLIFKIVKKFFKSIYINPFSKNITYIYGQNYSYIDNFSKLLFNSKKIIFINKIPKMNIYKKQKLNINKEHKEIISQAYREILKNYDRSQLDNDGVIFELFFQRYENVLESIKLNLDKYKNLFENIIKFNKDKKFLFFNGFYSIEERLFEEFCLKKKLITVGFEHGATTSISNFRKIYDNFHGSKNSTIGIYYTKRAKEFMSNIVNKQIQFVSGSPKRYQKSFFFNNIIVKYFLKKILKLPTNKKLILLIADIDVNNFVLTPQRDTNFKYIKKTKFLINYLKKNFNDSHILIKIYPGKRFINPYYFKDDMNSFTSRLQNIDLRFITNLFDQIITTSTDSGLGWAMSSKKKLFFKSFYWAKSDFIYIDKYNLKKRSIINISKEDFLVDEDKNLIKKIYDKK